MPSFGHIISNNDTVYVSEFRNEIEKDFFSSCHELGIKKKNVSPYVESNLRRSDSAPRPDFQPQGYSYSEGLWFKRPKLVKIRKNSYPMSLLSLNIIIRHAYPTSRLNVGHI